MREGIVHRPGADGARCLLVHAKYSVLLSYHSKGVEPKIALNNIAKRTATLNMLAHKPMGLTANTWIGGQLERASYPGNFPGFCVETEESQ